MKFGSSIQLHRTRWDYNTYSLLNTCHYRNESSALYALDLSLTLSKITFLSIINRSVILEKLKVSLVKDWRAKQLLPSLFLKMFPSMKTQKISKKLVKVKLFVLWILNFFFFLVTLWILIWLLVSYLISYLVIGSTSCSTF